MKVITFGEIMMRLNPEGYLRFVQADKYVSTFAGAEANVAVSLANFGVNAAFVTKLPEHEIGQSVVNSLRRHGVNTDKIVRGGERVGILFLEKGASQRPSKVIYDRKYSSIATARKEEFDWDKIFNGASWFHLGGTTPALSDTLMQISLEAVKKAKEKGLTVSFDINYREKLWDKRKARQTLSKILPFVDYCKDLFWYEDCNDINETVGKMTNEFGLKGVAVTFREERSANDNTFSGVFFTNGKEYHSGIYDIHIVDRVGSGDGFTAGFIYSLLNGYTPQKTIDFAVAASCLKHSIEGDYNLVSLQEVETLLSGNASGRVQR